MHSAMRSSPSNRWPPGQSTTDSTHEISDSRYRTASGDAETTVLTVRWTTVCDYNIHYSDASDRDLRWDLHPHSFSAPPDDCHFHPPPDAKSTDSPVEPSRLGELAVGVGARAVHLL